MAVSKRLRFEILRRDNHACRYCGLTAPDGWLEIDHVVPKALGGTDEPSNLCAACVDCNAGKGSIAPGSPLVADVASDAFRWARAMRFALADALKEREAVEEVVAAVDAAWGRFRYDNGNPVPRPADWYVSVEQIWGSGLQDVAELVRLVDVAMSRPGVLAGDRWRFWCGCCWRSIEDLHARARTILAAETEA